MKANGHHNTHCTSIIFWCLSLTLDYTFCKGRNMAVGIYHCILE